jgi:hypothetical protein
MSWVPVKLDDPPGLERAIDTYGAHRELVCAACACFLRVWAPIDKAGNLQTKTLKTLLSPYAEAVEQLRLPDVLKPISNFKKVILTELCVNRDFTARRPALEISIARLVSALRTVHKYLQELCVNKGVFKDTEFGENWSDFSDAVAKLAKMSPATGDMDTLEKDLEQLRVHGIDGE